MSLAAGQTVLFIGDSITHAHRRAEEVHDCYQLGCGYANSAAAELSAAHPTAGWRFVNRGACGDTVRHLRDRWEADCLASRPAVVSILVGVNDAHAADASPDRFADDYRHLVDLTRRRLPAARVVLLEPFGLAVEPHPTVDVISPGQLDRLATLRPVVREVATATGSLFIPLQHLFDRPPATAWMLDGIHPSAAGHWHIARAWVDATRGAGWFPVGGRVKATFVGGGSLRLLGILRGAMGEPGVLDGGEVCLYDLDAARADAMAGMLRKTPEYARAGCRVTCASTLAAAVDGADMVGVILMAGSAESFARGADACYRRGFIPSDNVSPNVAFLAAKGGQVLLEIARHMAERCPGAMLVDFANPVAVLSGMLNNHTPVRALGVCAGYTNHQWDLSRLLGKDEQGMGFDVDVAGVNHLSFVVNGTVAGRELFAALRRRTARGWKPPKLSPAWPAAYQKAIPAGLRVVVQFLHELGVLIFSTEGDGMMHLRYDAALAEHLRTFRPSTRRQVTTAVRAAGAARVEADRQFRSYLDRDLDAPFWEDGWRQPGLAWARRQDRDIFVQVLAGLSGARRVKVVTSRPNAGAIAGFTDRTVVEYSQVIDHGRVTAAGRYEVPAPVYGVVAALAAHQTLLGDAVAANDPKLLAQALLSYPVRPYSRAARDLYRTLATINADQVPPSLRRVAEFL